MNRRVLLIVVGFLTTMLAVSCAAPPSQPGGPDSAGPPIPALGVSGTSLTLDGDPWWPIGLNAYQLATDWSVNAGCGAEVDLDTFFGRLPRPSLVRFNAYSSLAVNKHTGQLDFSAIDAVVKAAERHGQMLIAVLSNNEGSCEDGAYKDYRWYTDGWRTDVSPASPMTFEAWIDIAVRRWKDSPALVGWTAVGEPEPSTCRDARCDWTRRHCPPDAPDVLRAFFDATGAKIREIDPDTTIFSGHAGGGQCGAAGEAFEQVSASPGVDVLEYHYYQGDDSLPGNAYDGLVRRTEQARAVNKPLLITEIGMKAGSCGSLEQRARVLRDTFTEMRGHGTAGAMFWSFVPDPRPGECTLDIGPNDPLMRLVGAG